MLLFIRIFLVLYGLIAVGTGFLGIFAKYSADIEPMTDNNHRFIAAIWASMSLGFFYTAWVPSEVVLFRFLMIAIFIGGIVRAISLLNYPPSPAILAGIALEVIPTPILWYIHSKLLNTGLL